MRCSGPSHIAYACFDVSSALGQAPKLAMHVCSPEWEPCGGLGFVHPGPGLLLPPRGHLPPQAPHHCGWPCPWPPGNTAPTELPSPHPAGRSSEGPRCPEQSTQVESSCCGACHKVAVIHTCTHHETVPRDQDYCKIASATTRPTLGARNSHMHALLHTPASSLSLSLCFYGHDGIPRCRGREGKLPGRPQKATIGHAYPTFHACCTESSRGTNPLQLLSSMLEFLQTTESVDVCDDGWPLSMHQQDI